MSTDRSQTTVPASWPAPVCGQKGCGVLIACFRPDCPALPEFDEATWEAAKDRDRYGE